MMQSNLVIVESPAKAKTIEKILGADFMVKSSFGHIRDLEKKGISIDIEHGFEPHYVVSEDKKKIVDELKKLSKAATTVWLASDEDREGEAIAWHLEQTLALEPSKTRRIVFHEITPTAIHHAVENPREIDLKMVDAQQARRILDRLVGFELSPLLWKKVKPSLSAGRVQSVVVKLIVEREREILTFQSTPYWRVVAEFLTPKGEKFKAELKERFDSHEQAEQFLQSLLTTKFTVADVTTTPTKRSPAPPFTTSTLQQEASRKLGFSVSQTMSVAQKLYEAGLITYMRTDSVHLSGLAIGKAKDAILATFGEKYHKVRQYTTKSKGAQEAHEAIRPAYLDRPSAGSTLQEQKLYELIWKRTVATQMADAQLLKTTININVEGQKARFVATGEIIVFDGFLKLYIESKDDDNSGEATEGLLPKMAQGDILDYKTIEATERFTQHAPRYSEAALVKKLEELGIGRPSTYAPTISTVITRGYVVKESREAQQRDYSILTLSAGKITTKTKSENYGAEKQKLFPTDIGMVVTDYLQQHFADVLDYSFTASVEEKFDDIAAGVHPWREMLKEFYTPFHHNIEDAGANSDYARSERVLGTDPKSGKQVVARVGRYGPMVQIGDAEEKRFASLQKGQLIESITLEDAMGLFALPREVGTFEEKPMVVNAGRFGPYVRHDGAFTSLAKEDDPYTISAERCIELIEAKRDKDKNRVIHNFTEIGLQVLNGRWGPYIAFQEKNYRIPKTTDAAALTLDDCKRLVDEGEKAGTVSVPKKRTFGKKK